MLNTADAYLRRFPFQAAIIIDSPTLHLPLAARAHAAGIPVLYYVAPQMWAWGAHRIHRLRNHVSHLACILPFEESYFRSQGIDATYVGHPLAEVLAETQFDQRRVDSIRSSGNPVLTLLPGSRRHVVKEVLSGQLEVARGVAEHFPRCVIGVSVANPTLQPVVDQLIRLHQVSVRTFTENRTEWLRAADLVLVTSGTSTLEVAFQTRPMIVMYNASRLLYYLVARWMIKTKYFSLPNILAGREIVPEFVPFYPSTKIILDRAIQMLRSESMRQTMSNELSQIVQPLRSGSPSHRVCDLLEKIAHRSLH
jgi:lipid-A-disaccharide synthase